MIVNPISLETAKEIRHWRNLSREGLRTGWTTEAQQEAFYENNFKGYMYWEFLENVKTQDKEGKDVEGIAPLAAGGLVGIEWVPRRAEIAIIVNPMARKKGFGSRCVEWILHEGFVNLGLQTIWGEVYTCGAASFWNHFIEKYKARITVRQNTKYWAGTFYGSTFFDFDRGKYEAAIADVSSRNSDRNDQPIVTST
jgi:hypothetical protein